MIYLTAIIAIVIIIALRNDVKYQRKLRKLTDELTERRRKAENNE